jgi:menaquinone-dependent protoporphyrinogen IX oxidase
MQRKIGIYCASLEGQTEVIAAALAERFGELGWRAELTDLERSERVHARNILRLDAVLLGAPVSSRCYPVAARRFVLCHKKELSVVGMSGFFSVCPGLKAEEPEFSVQASGPIRFFLDRFAWNPTWVASFAGSGSEDYRREAVSRFAADIAASSQWLKTG